MIFSGKVGESISNTMPIASETNGQISDDDTWLRRNDNFDPKASNYAPTSMDVDCVTQEDILKKKRREYQREYRKRKGRKC